MRLVIDANTIVSGLFFPGPERRLLLESIRGRVRLVFPEDIVEEVRTVMERFRHLPDFVDGLAVLNAVLARGERVGRSAYEAEVIRWRRRLRDPSDAPVLACAIVARVDGIVSGDKDVLELKGRLDVPVYRTREVLEAISGGSPDL